MERRKFVIGLGALATGSSAAIGTGALNVFEADRDAEITVVDDTNAYVGLLPGTEGNSSTESGGYAEINDDGELEITIDKLNPNAKSKFVNVFRIRNNIDPDDVDYGGDISFELDFEWDGGASEEITLLIHKDVGNEVQREGGTPGDYDPEVFEDGNAGPFVFKPGRELQVDLQIDTTEVDHDEGGETEIADTLTVRAEEPDGADFL